MPFVRRGQLDNTLVFFIADNGGCAEEIGTGWKSLTIPEKTFDGRDVKRGNNPAVMPGPEDTYQSYGLPWANASNTPFRRYKHHVHEGGISSPLIVHWPKGFPARGEFRETTGHVIDIMSTCLDVAGVEYPTQYGTYAIEALEGTSLAPAFRNDAIERDAIFWEHEGNRAVRQGKWKLVAKHKGPWELYDLEADRSETNDLATSDPERLAGMQTLYEEWADRCDVEPWPPKKKKKTNQPS